MGIGKRFVAMGRAHSGGLIAPEATQFSSFVMSHFCGAVVAQWPWALLGLCDTAEWEGTAST